MSEEMILYTKKTYEFSELNRITGPLVYIWYRLGVCMYVGSSRVGLIRPLGIGHKTLPHVWTTTDTLEVLYFTTAVEALKFEREYIAEYAPKLNKVECTK